MEPAASNATSDAGNQHVWLYAACAALGTVLLCGGPLFICQPLWADATHYDVLAQEVLRGRTLYLDVTDTNFPGAVWIHALVRGTAGWSSEVLRVFDLLVVAGIAGVLTHVATRGRERTAALRIFVIAAVLLYYFACTPMVHCQRDVWMLLPAALAVWLRFRRISKTEGASPAVFGGALLEGVLWGAAVWIKPYVIVPALGCWLAGLIFGIRNGSLGRWNGLIDALGLVAGGLIAGAGGCAWLMAVGSWPHFWDMMLNWSGEYRSRGDAWSLRIATNLSWYFYFAPWSLLHLITLPLAGIWCFQGLAASQDGATRKPAAAKVLLAALYLCWFVQGSLIQLSHEYVLSVSMLIALPMLLCWDRVAMPATAMRIGLAVFAAAALVAHPFAKQEALATWPLCFSRGSSPLVKHQLSTGANRHVMGEAHWQDLAKVEEYLRSRDVSDGELACWDDSSHVLYTKLKVSPSNRFIHTAVWLSFFQSRQDEIIEEIQQGNPRFVITDVQMAGYSAFVARDEYQRDEPVFPKGMPEIDTFPWNEPIVFRAGRYLVHEVSDNSAGEPTDP